MTKTSCVLDIKLTFNLSILFCFSNFTIEIVQLTNPNAVSRDKSIVPASAGVHRGIFCFYFVFIVADWLFEQC